MKDMKTWLNVWAIALAMTLTVACGDKGASVPADISGYEKAVTAFLERESMGMKVAEFESVQEDGDGATAMVRLQDAEGMTSIKVKWEFTFTKSDDGWTVKSGREAK